MRGHWQPEWQDIAQEKEEKRKGRMEDCAFIQVQLEGPYREVRMGMSRERRQLSKGAKAELDEALLRF